MFPLEFGGEVNHEETAREEARSANLELSCSVDSQRCCVDELLET